VEEKEKREAQEKEILKNGMNNSECSMFFSWVSATNKKSIGVEPESKGVR